MIRRLLREPLVRFLVLGALIFGVDRALAHRDDGGAGRRIVVDRSFVDGLAREEERRTGSRVDAQHRALLVRGFVREEVLTREAVALGLDRGDPILRRRLAQKTELYLEATLVVPTPTTAELDEYEREHAARYRDDARTTFEHAFFASSTRGPRAEGDARDVLGSGIDEHSGDAFAGGRSFLRTRDAELARLFGDDFVTALHAAPLGTWTGPVASRVGAHLVRVRERTPARLPPLAEIHDAVARDFTDDARRAAVEHRVDALIGEYDVVQR